jgi:hypothetical protein
MIKSTKAFLLAGASALAILACAAEANAETFTMPGMFSFTAAVSGEYAVELLGASGGNSTEFMQSGGPGAEVSGDVFLTAGEDLTLIVGGQGAFGPDSHGGGGGGGSFVFHGTDVLAVAGGGGGAGYGIHAFLYSAGGVGVTGRSGGYGERGYRYGGGAGGLNGNGGYGGDGGGGGGGAGVSAAGHNAYGPNAGLGGEFPNGGGGGSDLGGGGGGSGFSGGGGGGGVGLVGNGNGSGGGGGGSYLASLFTDQVLTGGVNSGDGSISVDLLAAAVPEPSTWAMALTGFAGLGFLAHMRKRKLTAA